MELFIELAKIVLEAGIRMDFPVFKLPDSVRILFTKNKSIISKEDKWLEVCFRDKKTLVRFSNTTGFQTEIFVTDLKFVKEKINEFSTT